MGTLWWIREDVWAAKFGGYHSHRKSHPGLSVNESNPGERKSYVPMLHGRSERRGNSVEIRGLTKHEPEKISYFGHFGPVQIDAVNFTPDTTSLPDDPHWIKRASIIANNHKPRITPDEQDELVGFIAAKRERQMRRQSRQ